MFRVSWWLNPIFYLLYKSLSFYMKKIGFIYICIYINYSYNKFFSGSGGKLLTFKMPIYEPQHVIYFQQCGILKSLDSYQLVQLPFKIRNSECCSGNSLTLIEYSSDLQRLWSDCAYALADLSLCWSHIPHCWKSHVVAQLCVLQQFFQDYVLIQNCKSNFQIWLFSP